MDVIRVGELAAWAEMDADEVVRTLRRFGHRVDDPGSTVTMAEADRFASAVQAERRDEGLGKRRVHEVAKELGRSSAELRRMFVELGVPATSHASTVRQFDVGRLHERLSADAEPTAPEMTDAAPRAPLPRRVPVRMTPRTSAATAPTSTDAAGGGTGTDDAAADRDAPETLTVPDRPGDRALLLRMLRELRPHARGLALVLALHLLAAPLMLLQPIPLKIAVDSVIGDTPVPRLLAALTPEALTDTPLRLLAVVALLHVLLMGAIQLQSMGTYVATTATGERITLGFRARMFRHVQRLSLAFHDRRGTYESLYRIEYDAPSLQHTADTVIPFVSSGVTLVVILVVTARIDLSLALVALAVCPVLFWLSRQHVREIRGGYQELRELETTALGVVQEVLSAVRVVKAFGREDSEARRFTHRYGASMRAKVRLAVRESSYGLWINVTTAAGTALVLGIGVRNVLAGTTTLGELLVVIAYLAALYGPLEEIAQRVGDLQSSLAGAQRAFELLDELPEVTERSDARRLDRADGELTFEGVCFGYDADRPVLRDVDLVVEAGARVGVVGRTGAGKTTLISLLMRFYDPDAGTVRLDGVDVRDIDLADLRNQYGLMLQEPVLFSTSITENIRYARPDATDEDVEAAAKAADAHDFILRLPDGYDTRVGERGMLLSGGERQRVSLARAFLRDAPVLILDEPTSSVDDATEASIMAAMERLMAGRTTLMIAHRRSTLDSCDAIVEVRDGGVRVVGSSGDLDPPKGIPAAPVTAPS
ncbi:ATP-binding cassette domain-containing protein [Nitriliruptor alkaliphilus]|uniref:ATP-binding cassette domain-containing protein n=1 Tax=Nitriliruptor alkaliphilus TaxID=427918 RepID=UPI000A7EB8A3|nr:ATP-binding cassette domain-containing protein [Nitriliruptor alkaliphilus]